MHKPRLTNTHSHALVILALLVGSTLCGCTRNPYAAPYGAGWAGPTAGQYPPGAYPNTAQAPVTGPQSVFAQQQTSPQMIQLQQRIQGLDTDNRQLTAQLAQQQQQNQALVSQMQAIEGRYNLLAKQLQDSVDQNKKLAAASQAYADQARGMQASMEMRGGARLTANNSLRGAAVGIQIGGAQVLQDGDLLRIRLPADGLFSNGSAMLSPAGTQQLDQVATVILQRFSRQRVAVEGHTDGGQSYGGFGTPYKQAGDQAQAVMDQLVQRNRLPTQQLFVVAHGPNHPLAENQSEQGRAANRRIEVVIYPDTF